MIFKKPFPVYWVVRLPQGFPAALLCICSGLENHFKLNWYRENLRLKRAHMLRVMYPIGTNAVYYMNNKETCCLFYTHTQTQTGWFLQTWYVVLTLISTSGSVKYSLQVLWGASHGGCSSNQIHFVFLITYRTRIWDSNQTQSQCWEQWPQDFIWKANSD